MKQTFTPEELIGKKIVGVTFNPVIIAQIVGCADNFGHTEDNWYIEFIDPKGNYHYWKQGCDGGELR